VLLDSSALVALVMAERPACAVFNAMAGAPARAIGAPTLVETAMVLAGRRAVASPDATSDLTLVCVGGDFAQTDLTLVPLTA